MDLIEKGSPDQPVGRIALLRKDIVENNALCYSNFIHKIRIDETKVLPEYLFSFLKTIHNIKITEIMQSQTSGIRNLIMSEYFNQDIVLPNLSIQQKIAAEIKKRRSKAKTLEKEAQLEVENARQKVEEIIWKGIPFLLKIDKMSNKEAINPPVLLFQGGTL